MPLASVDRLTAATLQTALEKSMPVAAMSGHAGVVDTARFIVFILHCDGAAANDKIREPAPHLLAESVRESAKRCFSVGVCRRRRSLM